VNGLPELAIAHPLWTWLAVAAAFGAVEVVTGSGWLLWPAAAGLITAGVTLVAPLAWPEAIVLFGVLTIIATYLGRRYLRPAAKGAGADVNDPNLRLVGHTGTAVSAFENGQGRVFVDGKEWSAIIDDGAGALTSGSRVKVAAVLTGARLRVTAISTEA
jgi:hypothetical protein